MLNERYALIVTCLLILSPLLSLAGLGEGPNEAAAVDGPRDPTVPGAGVVNRKDVCPSVQLTDDGRIGNGEEMFAGSGARGVSEPVFPVDTVVSRFDRSFPDGSPGTRASDQEREQDYHDFANGTRINDDGEVISGSLTYVPGETGDIRDWYKLAAPDVNPAPGSALGPRNVSITMTSYLDSNDTHNDLYEYRLVESGTPGQTELESDYFDYIRIHVLYYDPWMGFMDVGGTIFFYDDMDPADSWEHAGNWTFRFSTPVPSTGPEDMDGFAGGLDEVGWYYISFSMDWGAKPGAPDRSGFGVHYVFDIDTSDRDVTDDGANTIETTGSYQGSEEKVLDSRLDQVDWYRFTGSDPGKLWNMSFSIERTYGAGSVIPSSDTTGTILDTWMYVLVVFPWVGDDGEWGTSDDGWSLGASVRFSYFITGPGSITGPQFFNFTVTNPTIGDPDRGVYIGLFVEPVTASYDGTSITGYYYTYWTTFSNYTIDMDVIEESPNRAPVVSDLSVTSDNRFHETGGDVTDTFVFRVTYMDPDNDLPERLDLILDPGESTEKTFSMLSDPDSGDVTNGKEYSLSLSGSQIGDKDSPYVLLVNATDSIPVESLRRPLASNDLYLNDTLRVWNDREVSVYAQYESIDPLDEDGGRVLYPLDSYNLGPFEDPERSLRGVMVFNESRGAYWGDSLSDMLHVNITYRDGDGWYAAITPLPDRHGEEVISFYGYDDHSYAIVNLTVTVYSVNDPPVVLGVRFDGTSVEVDDTDPFHIQADLRSMDILEDTTYELDILAEDSDPEEDRTDLVYEYIGGGARPWSEEPVVNRDTGVVTFTPSNADVRTNGYMTFRISDAEDFIELKVLMDVKNTPDDPVLTLEPKSPLVYQDEAWTLYSRVTDVDPGDSHLFSINMEEEIGGDIPSVADQLPYAELGTDLVYTFDADSGYLTLTPRSDEIWRTSDALLTEVKITLVVKVTDLYGRSDMKIVNLTMEKDGPWIPDVPEWSYEIEDLDPVKAGAQGLNVTFTAEDYDPAYGGDWIYTWNMGDGTTLTGKEVRHTYTSEGNKTVRLTLINGDYSSSSNSKRIHLERYVPPVEDHKNGEEGSSLGTLIWVGLALLVIAVVVVVVILILGRRKGGPGIPEGELEGPGHEMGRGEPGTMERRPPSSSQPQKAGSREATLRCPTCGAPVKRDWFLCPECKNTLNF